MRLPRSGLSIRARASAPYGSVRAGASGLWLLATGEVAMPESRHGLGQA